MQRPVSFTQGQRKPWAGRPRLNFAHPLAKNLIVYCYDWNGQIIDLVNHTNAKVTNPGGRVGSAAGFGQKFNPTTTFASLPALPAADEARLGANTPYSIWMATYFTAAAVSQSPNPDGSIVCVNDANNNEDTTVGFTMFAKVDGNAQDQIGCVFNDAISEKYANNFGVPNTFQTWSASCPSTSLGHLYSMGIFDHDYTGSVIDTDVVTPQVMYNTARADILDFGHGINGMIPAFAFWNKRVLTATDHAELQHRPWNPYRIPLLIFPEDEVLTRRLRGPATASAGSFLPSLPLTGVG